MKHIVTQLEGKNEPMYFSPSVLGNYFIEIEPGNYQAKESNSESDTQSEFLQFSWTDNIDCNIVNLASNLESNTSYVQFEDKFWLLYFDGSKTQEGSGSICVLVDRKKNKHFISCMLELKCTNNTIECEALVQGLKKDIEFKVRNFKFLGDSEIIII